MLMTQTLLEAPVRSYLIRRPHASDWSSILAPTCGLLIVARPPVISDTDIELAKHSLNDVLAVAGKPDQLSPALSGLPENLSADIVELATNFAGLMRVDTVRVRLETINGDACREWHLDYTDIRLVVTYAGPGTQFRPSEQGPIEEVGTQQIALFKGRCFGEGHALVHHRSPPIAGTGTKRLLLVIDTPERDEMAPPIDR